MTDFFTKLSDKILSSGNYLEATQKLFSSYIFAMVGGVEALSRDDIKKLATAAQIFYKAEGAEYRSKGATILSMLLDLYANEHPELIPISNHTFANCGDFPNIQLLLERHPDVKFEYNFYTDAIIEFRRDLNTVEPMSFTLTDFQRSLWEELKSEHDVITSAPTSTGKTHIILNYLLDEVLKSEGAFVAVIVPTRALITEVSAKVYELIKERNAEEVIEVSTVSRDGGYKEKTFFVMTQERLHEVLLRGDINFNYLFIDEAQNITDQSRGVLLHIIIEKILEDSNPQVIISMPSSSYQNSFTSIFRGMDFKKKVTKHSPVAKILIDVTPRGRSLQVSLNNSTNTIDIPKNFKGTDLADIVVRLGQGQSNIIYRNKTDACEHTANKITQLLHNVRPSEELEEAADYVENFIHEEFTLSDNLRKGVAFHYGPLPSNIRIMVENLVKTGHIKYIACTSTLAEGVNLPAKNLFLDNPVQLVPYQSAERIEDVNIKNITGRAGRMLHHFSGNIFLIKPEDWTFKDYFDENQEDSEKVPTYFKSINEEFDNVILALEGAYDYAENDQYKLYAIANKLIKEYGNDNLDITLNAEDLTISSDQRDRLLESVELAHDALQVAPLTLEANPNVGYIQQNNLHNFLSQQANLNLWILPHPADSSNLYNSLLKICNKLIELGVFIPNDNNRSTEYISIITRKWIQGSSLKEIISEQVRKDRERSDTVNANSSVRKVIKLINNDIRFRLSNALRCYQLLLDSLLVERGAPTSNVKIHAYIEVGAYKERVINLINLGLSREAAIEIDGSIDSNIVIQSFTDLKQLISSNALLGIHNITKKELELLIN